MDEYLEIFDKHYDYLCEHRDVPPKDLLYTDLVGTGGAMVQAGLPLVKQIALERGDCWFTNHREYAALALTLFELCGSVFIY